jgi:hypothetical protein
MGFVVWAFYCQLKYRSERSRDLEAGNEKMINECTDKFVQFLEGGI